MIPEFASNGTILCLRFNKVNNKEYFAVIIGCYMFFKAEMNIRKPLP